MFKYTANEEHSRYYSYFITTQFREDTFVTVVRFLKFSHKSDFVDFRPVELSDELVGESAQFVVLDLTLGRLRFK